MYWTSYRTRREQTSKRGAGLGARVRPPRPSFSRALAAAACCLIVLLLAAGPSAVSTPEKHAGFRGRLNYTWGASFPAQTRPLSPNLMDVSIQTLVVQSWAWCPAGTNHRDQPAGPRPAGYEPEWCRSMASSDDRPHSSFGTGPLGYPHLPDSCAAGRADRRHSRPTRTTSFSRCQPGWLAPAAGRCAARIALEKAGSPRPQRHRRHQRDLANMEISLDARRSTHGHKRRYDAWSGPENWQTRPTPGFNIQYAM